MDGQKVSTRPNTTASVKLKVVGVSVVDPVLVTAQGDYINWSIYSSYVSNKDEVSIRFANFTDVAVNVKGSEYKIVIIK